MPASACVPVKRDRFFAGSQAGVADVKLAYALERNLEAALLVGDSGTGKTTLLRRFAARVAASGSIVIDVFFPQLDVDGLLAFVEAELSRQTRSAGLREEEGRERRLRRIAEGVRRLAGDDRGIVLMIDDAHLVQNVAVFETMQQLLNLRERENARFTVILAGQKPLLAHLSRMPAFAQRVGITATLAPLLSTETAEYVRHRLDCEPCDVEAFESRAIAAIHDHAAGIPRRIDRLCDMAILVASQNGSRTVTAQDVQFVAAERCLLDGGLP